MTLSVFRRVLGLTVVLTALVALAAPAANAQTTLKPEEQQVLDLVNQQRAANGLQPLTVDTRLVDAARAHNAKMIQSGEFSHQVTGEPPMCLEGANNDRYDAVGYAWIACGENIAAGQKTPQDVMTAWMGSSGHRANILNPSFKNIGIGYTTGGGYGVYWTQDFGTTNGVVIPPPDPGANAKSSLVWRNTANGQNTLWLMDGGAVLSYPSLPAVTDLSWKIVAVGDLNADGKADLVWRNSANGQTQAWLLNGGAAPTYAALPTVADATWKVIATGDLDGDGKTDLVWRNATSGQTSAWLMNGGSVTSYPWLPTVADPTWKLVGVGDLNADGKADLVWRNSVSDQNNAWLMNGASVTSYGALPTVIDPTWKLVGLGDLDGNRKADLVWRNTVTGQNAAWLMNGTSVASYAALPTVTDQTWKLVASHDLNADGKADLVWRNTATGQNNAWLMNGAMPTSYPWLPTVADAAWQAVSPTSLLAALNDTLLGQAKAAPADGAAKQETFWTTAPIVTPAIAAPSTGAPPMVMTPAQTEAPMWSAPSGEGLPGASQ